MKSKYIKIPYTPSITVTRPIKPEKSVSSIRDELVKYAMQFKGNPYAYGRISLTEGTDCSGFTQSVFRHMGILLPRTSEQQACCGRMVPLNKLQPGDLIFYSKKGVIDHVALYTGDGNVIHASCPKSGIKVSRYDYRKPYKAVTYIDI